MRAVRRRRPARRQRAACARASRQHGPLGRDGDPGEGRQHAPRRRVHAQRAVQRRHAPARHHRRQPVFAEDGASVLFYLASRGHHADIGGIAPGSMSPLARSIDEEGVYIDCFAARRRRALSRARNADRCWPVLNTRRAIRRRTSPTSRRRWPPTHAAKPSSRRWWREFGLDAVRSYMGHVQDMARGGVRRLISRLDDGHFRVETDDGWAVEVRITVDREQRSAQDRFHRHVGAAGFELQCAGAGDARGSAVCVPRAGRRADPDECRLPAAARDRHSGGLAAEAAVSGGRRRRQRGDEPDRDQCAVRGARRASARRRGP